MAGSSTSHHTIAAAIAGLPAPAELEKQHAMRWCRQKDEKEIHDDAVEGEMHDNAKEEMHASALDVSMPSTSTAAYSSYYASPARKSTSGAENGKTRRLVMPLKRMQRQGAYLGTFRHPPSVVIHTQRPSDWNSPPQY